MNITDLLREDHRMAESLIAQLAGEATHETFGKLKNALTVHTQIEEDIFYPALEEFEETEELIDEAYEEHNDVDQLLEKMDAAEIPGDDFQDLLVQLKDAIDHHVEEEENQLFPRAERLLGETTLEEMGNSAEKSKGKYELSNAQSM